MPVTATLQYEKMRKCVKHAFFVTISAAFQLIYRLSRLVVYTATVRRRVDPIISQIDRHERDFLVER